MRRMIMIRTTCLFYVEAGGNWYKVDLSVTGADTPTMVDRCLQRPRANQDVEHILPAYYNKGQSAYIARNGLWKPWLPGKCV